MDAFLDTLISQGALESQGTFTLNRQRLQEQYARFQEQNSNYFLLQGLVDLNPEQVQINLLKGETVLAAVKPSLKQSLDLGELFGKGNALSQGLITCFFEEIGSVVIRSQEGALRIDGMEQGTFTEAQGEDEFRISFKPPDPTIEARVSGFWRRLFGETDRVMNYHRVISNAFDCGAIPVRLDGRVVNNPSFPLSWGRFCVVDRQMPRPRGVWAPPSTVKVVRGHLSGYDGSSWGCLAVVATTSDPIGSSVMRFVDRGLTLDVLLREFDCPKMEAVVSTYGLKTDASGLAVVRDDAFEQRIKEVEAAVRRMALRFQRT